MNSSQFPKSHVILSIVLGLTLCSFVIAKFSGDPDDDRFTTETVLLDLPTVDDINGQAFLPGAAAASQDPAPTPRAVTNTTTKKVSVAPGDNLALLFKQHGLSPQELHRLVTTKPLGPRLKEIFPGHELRFTVDDANTLVKLEYSPGPLEVLEFTRVGDGYEGVEVVAEPERVTAYKHAIIDHSLFIASQRAGLDDSITMRLAQIFQWDIDFVLDIRAGDEFYVLFEELYLGDRFIGYGKSWLPNSSIKATVTEPFCIPIPNLMRAITIRVGIACARHFCEHPYRSRESVPTSTYAAHTRCGNARCRIEA